MFRTWVKVVAIYSPSKPIKVICTAEIKKKPITMGAIPN